MEILSKNTITWKHLFKSTISDAVIIFPTIDAKRIFQGHKIIISVLNKIKQLFASSSPPNWPCSPQLEIIYSPTTNTPFQLQFLTHTHIALPPPSSSLVTTLTPNSSPVHFHPAFSPLSSTIFSWTVPLQLHQPHPRHPAFSPTHYHTLTCSDSSPSCVLQPRSRACATRRASTVSAMYATSTHCHRTVSSDGQVGVVGLRERPSPSMLKFLHVSVDGDVSVYEESRFQAFLGYLSRSTVSDLADLKHLYVKAHFPGYPFMSSWLNLADRRVHASLHKQPSETSFPAQPRTHRVGVSRCGATRQRRVLRQIQLHRRHAKLRQIVVRRQTFLGLVECQRWNIREKHAGPTVFAIRRHNRPVQRGGRRVWNLWVVSMYGKGWVRY